MWIFGQGFPKSTDISKQIDKQSGMERKVVGIRKSGRRRSGKTSSVGQYLINYGPYIPITEPATPEAKLWNGWHTHGLKPAYEPIIVAMKPNDGSYAENALKWGVAGLNIEEARISYKNDEDKKSGQSARPSLTKDTMFSMGGLDRSQRDNIQGRYPANIILDEEAAQELDKQSGISRSRANIKSDNRKNNGKSMFLDGIHNPENSYNDTGGASRFFKVIEDDYPRFIYCAKASRSERNRGCEELEDKPAGQSLKDDNYTRENMGNTPAVNREPTKNNHPTVKPLKLLEYLCILTKTPTGGIILDPFAGSGTTCMAAKKIGRTYIGIEQDEEYCKIARARIDAIEPKKNLF
jgi:site-specific DNA-methyltransferase (adenine-specific)